MSMWNLPYVNFLEYRSSISRDKKTRNFHLVIETPDHVYVFSYRLNGYLLFFPPSPFRIPRPYTCVQAARAKVNVAIRFHCSSIMLRHTRISTGCSDVTMLRLFFSYSIYPPPKTYACQICRSLCLAPSHKTVFNASSEALCLTL